MDVICFGSATVDIFVDTFDRKQRKKKSNLEYKHMIQYPIGDKILIEDLDISIGGGGTNTAVTFNQFGFNTAYVGALGEDYYGIVIKEFLDKAKIHFLGHMNKDRTGTSIILDSIEHDRTVLTYKGANNNLMYSKIDKKMLGAKLYYFSSLIEESFKTMLKLLDYATKNNIKVAFNPSCYQAEKGKTLWSCLKQVNYLVLNKEEAQFLAENKSPHEKELMDILYKKLNPEERLVVITDGSSGAYCYDGKAYYKADPCKVKILESTGAGDAFASAFVSGILRGESIEKALKLGTANSASVITNKGAKDKILTLKEAEKATKTCSVKRI